MTRIDESRIRDIALEDIDRSRNHRIPRPGDPERLAALKVSIEACGQLQPVRVYHRGEDQKDPKHKQPYILGFGARRCTAMELLDRKTIRAVVFPPATDAEMAQARAVENLHRQDITPLEEVQAVSDVLEAIKADSTFTGDPYEEAAARLGCDVSWVRDRDYLHRLTKAVQRFASRSGLPAGHLRELAKVGDPAEQLRLACESAGAPSHAFSSDPKETKLAPWQQQLQDGYFGEVLDGKVHRWTLTQLKNEVAKVRLSLKVIPWEFDKPVEFGAIKLRKCAGCTHNSETDRTLFGIDEDAGNPQGFCLYASCYKDKYKATDAAKEQILKKISTREDQSPEAIRKITPGWLKESTVVGYVKRQLEKAANAEGGKSGNGKHTPQPRTAAAGRPLTEHELALQKFAEAFGAWEKAAFVSVLEGINADPVYRVGWCVLLGVPAFWEQLSMEIPTVRPYAAEACTEEPLLPPLPKEAEEAIHSVFKGTRNGWVELLKDCEQINPNERASLGIPHPRALELLAECVKVTLAPVPEWKAVGTKPAAEGVGEAKVAGAV
jgi:ParB/RepB/Spo0J family partition protein